MGADVVAIFGCILESPFRGAATHNDAVIASLTDDDRYSPLNRDMFEVTPRRRIILATSLLYREAWDTDEPRESIEEVLGRWIDKLEGFLSRIHFAQANIDFDFGLSEDNARLRYHRPRESIGSPEALSVPFVTWCFRFPEQRAEHGAVFNAVCHRPSFLPKPPDYWKDK